MAVDRETLARFRAYQQATEGAEPSNDLAELETIPEVIGWLVACARAKGSDEVDCVELLVTCSNLDKDQLRDAERVLRPLGYVRVAELLKRMARSRKRRPKPVGRLAGMFAPSHRAKMGL